MSFNYKVDFTSIVYFGVFFLLMYWVMPSTSIWVYIGISLLAICKSKSVLLLAVLNLVIGLSGISNSTFGALTNLYDATDRGLLASRAECSLIFIGCTFIFYLYALITASLSRALALGVLIVAALTVSIFFDSFSNHFKIATILFLQGIWYNAFFIATISRTSKVGLIEFLSCQRPFFCFEGSGMIPAPPLLGKAISSGRIDQIEKVRRQRQAIFLMLLIIFFQIFWSKIHLYAHSFSLIRAIVSPAEVKMAGLGTLKDLAFTLEQRWIITLGSFLYAIVAVIFSQGFSVAVCKLLGVDLKWPVYGIFTAKTPFDLFERFNHYYCRLLKDIFWDPFIGRLIFFQKKNFKFYLSASLAILVCGVVVRFFSTFESVKVRPLALKVPGAYLSFIYWLSMGIFICFSFETQVATKKIEVRHYITNINLSIYFVIFSILFIFLKEAEMGKFSVLDGILWIGKLFGI